ncbi:TOTE conflict system archaeo-eukaryotic primase domain-containing protein [Mycobacterium sp.]|uniref:TOTE conflict system archaeo-eukaryotic primase domain-containing protein n=1 Tax=Mycobacterium sp. TaxID=1785 RepID=UPI003C77A893
MPSALEAKLRFYTSLFRCRTDVYALRWENRRDGRSGWMPAIKGYWRKEMSRADASLGCSSEGSPVMAGSAPMPNVRIGANRRPCRRVRPGTQTCPGQRRCPAPTRH